MSLSDLFLKMTHTIYEHFYTWIYFYISSAFLLQWYSSQDMGPGTGLTRNLQTVSVTVKLHFKADSWIKLIHKYVFPVKYTYSSGVLR